MRRLSLPALMVGLLVFLAGCSAETPASRKEPPAARSKARVQKAAVTPVEAGKPEPVPAPVAAFVFSPEGLRDPFEPFIKLKKKKKAKVFVPKTPLQRYSTEELKLVGIVWSGSGKSKALIEDPEGQGYVATVGTLVGDRGGGIVQIRRELLLIEERFVDQLGEDNVRKVKMTLRRSEGEVSQ
jgi:type IV pilus assembly protein PilP